LKIRAVGAELFHAEGRTDMMKLMVEFRNYQSTPLYEGNIIRLVGGYNAIRGAVHFHFTELCLIVTTSFGTSWP